MPATKVSSRSWGRRASQEASLGPGLGPWRKLEGAGTGADTLFLRALVGQLCSRGKKLGGWLQGEEVPPCGVLEVAGELSPGAFAGRCCSKVGWAWRMLATTLRVSKMLAMNTRALKMPATNSRALGVPAANSKASKVLAEVPAANLKASEVPVGVAKQPGLLVDELPASEKQAAGPGIGEPARRPTRGCGP